jgi:hypothetical protein
MVLVHTTITQFSQKRSIIKKTRTWQRILNPIKTITFTWIVAPRPRFTPFGTHWIRGWMGPRAGLDAGARRKICPCRESNLDRPIVQPVVRHYTAWATAAPEFDKTQEKIIFACMQYLCQQHKLWLGRGIPILLVNFAKVDFCVQYVNMNTNEGWNIMKIHLENLCLKSEYIFQLSDILYVCRCRLTDCTV